MSAVALAKDEKKEDVDKKTTEKRGATSFTHIIRGGTGHSSLAGHVATTPFHALQVAYIPVATYGHGYTAPNYAAVHLSLIHIYTKEW